MQRPKLVARLSDEIAFADQDLVSVPLEPFVLGAVAPANDRAAVWTYAQASSAWIFGDSLGDTTADDMWTLAKDRPDGVPSEPTGRSSNRRTCSTTGAAALTADSVSSSSTADGADGQGCTAPRPRANEAHTARLALIYALLEISRTDVRDLFSRNKKAREIDRALGALEDAGGLARQPLTDGRGRPAELWIPQVA